MIHDLLVIGGGINGCGIARDAAGRGLSVVLFEAGDLAGATSSSSTKLIHGGLRYLEYGAFRLVREALGEREVLLAMAPHIIWPLRFVLPHHAGLRPAWLLRLGLFIYDHLGGRRLLPPTRSLDLARDPAGSPLKPGYGRAFEYSDCWVEDARLVVLNAVDAQARGARIETRARVVGAERGSDFWSVTVERDGMRFAEQARVVVNATGPWASQVLDGILDAHPDAHVRLVQGSHIVVSRLYEHDRCYIFQNADNRIVFAIPYERDFTLIGTTDLDWPGGPAHPQASPSEIAYLCAAASEYFAKPIAPADVVWTYSGLRPLYDDGASKAQAATRDYVLLLDAPAGRAPLLSAFGGKITTYRRLSEHALQKLAPFFPTISPKDWTAGAPLPGGDFPVAGFDALVARLKAEKPWLAPATARRLVRAYGTRAFGILADCTCEADMGRKFGADLCEVEVRYLMASEWARCAEDVLWRRTKLGLRVTSEDVQSLDAYMQARVSS